MSRVAGQPSLENPRRVRPSIIPCLVLVVIVTCCATARAVGLTPQDILQKTYLSEIDQLTPNAYVHFKNGVVLPESGLFVLPVKDLDIPIGSSSFILERSYGSRSASKGIFGVGWKFNYGMRLEESEESILVVEPGAGAFLFRKELDGRYVHDTSGYQTVTKHGDGSFTREDIGGKLQHFDRSGRLVKVADGNVSVFLSYEHDRLRSIGDRSASLVKLAYNAMGFVQELEDPSGRKSRFEYSSDGELTKEISFRGETTKYQYDKQHRMAAIEYGNGAIVHINYDSAGRVMSQKGPENLVTTYQYAVYADESRTTIIDPLSNKMSYSFKDGGRRVDITDFAGGKIQKLYDGKGNLLEFRNQTGQVLRCAYNHKNQVTLKTGFDGKSETYVYDAATDKVVSVRGRTAEAKIAYNPAGFMTRFEDGYGKATSYEYDNANNLSAILEPGGRRYAFEYDQNGRISKMILPDGSFQGYLYDMNGKVRRITDAYGKTIEHSFDSKGNVIKTTNQVGATDEMRYDESGTLIEHRNAVGTRTKFSFNLSHQIASIEQDQAGHKTTLHYDTKGRLKAVVRPTGARVSYKYDAMDRLTESTDDLGRSRKFAYDGAGRLVMATSPGGRKSSYRYDNKGLLIEATDERGDTTTYTHDELNRVVSLQTINKAIRLAYDSTDRIAAVEDPQAGYRITYQYDDRGNIVETDDTRSGRTLFRYDLLDRLVEVKSESGDREEYTYAQSGNLIETRSARRGASKHHYDPLGRLLKSESTREGQTAYAYDPLGNVIRLIDSSGTTREYEYDKVADQLIKVVENGAATRYHYDLAGNLRAMIDANGNETRSEYDKAGRLVKSIDPLRRIREFQYDADDRIVKIAREDGKTQKFVHNESGMPTKTLVNDKPVKEIGYDGLNRITREKGEGYSFSYVYDAAGNMVEKKDDLNNISVRYTYDQARNLVGVGLPDGGTISYVHDRFNNLASVTGPDDTQIAFGYDRFNRRDHVRLGRTATIRYDYNDNGTVKSIRYQKPDGAPIYSISYDYDAPGRIARADYNGQVFSYAYDERSRLREVNYPDGKTDAFRYDPSGNIIGVNASRLSYNAANQLTARDESRFAYDALGNLTEKKDRGTAVRYAYTDTGKLKSVLMPGNTSIAYQHDADGNLMMRQAGGSKTYYVNDRDDVVAELVDGQVRTIYLTGMTLDERLAKLSGGRRYYYITDISNSVLAVMNENAEIENSYLYEPFGRFSVLKEHVENDFYFQGRLYDKEAGLYDYRARSYDPYSMRFIQQDPYRGSIEDPASLNHYLFVKNNPVNFIDPLGLESVEEFVERLFPKTPSSVAPINVPSMIEQAKQFPYGSTAREFISNLGTPPGARVFPPVYSNSKVAEASQKMLDKRIMGLPTSPTGTMYGGGTPYKIVTEVTHRSEYGGLVHKTYLPGQQMPVEAPTLGGAVKSAVKQHAAKVLTVFSGGYTIAKVQTSETREYDAWKALGQWIGGLIGFGAGTGLTGGPIGGIGGSIIGANIGEKKMEQLVLGHDPSVYQEQLSHLQEKWEKEGYQKKFEEAQKKHLEEVYKESITTIKESGIPFDPKTGVASGTADVGEYNPLSDPNLKAGGKGPIDVAGAEKLSGEFQKGQQGGIDQTKEQGAQNVIQQPPSYTDPGKAPDATASGTTQLPYPPPYTPYPPGYPPETGQSGVRAPWDALIGPSSGHGGKSQGGGGGSGISPPPESRTGSSGTSSSPPSPPPGGGPGGSAKQDCTLADTCQGWAKGIDCARRKKQIGSLPSDCNISQAKVGICYYRAFDEGLRKGLGLTNSPKPDGC